MARFTFASRELSGGCDRPRQIIAHARAVPLPLRLIRVASWRLRLFFYIFVFSIPFETLNVGLQVEDVSLAKLTGYALVVFAAMEYAVAFRRPSAALGFFSAYIVLFMILGYTQDPAYEARVTTRLLQLGQLGILFWISQSVLREARIMREALLTLAASCSLLALLQATDVTSKWMDVAIRGGGERFTALGEDPNSAGMLLTLGALTILGMVFFRAAGHRIRIIGGVVLVLLASQLARTASRTAVVALIAGLAVFTLTGASDLKTRFRNTVVMLFAVVLLVLASRRSETNWIRWQNTMAWGDLDTREGIIPITIEMVLESPLLGWGPERHYLELARRLNKPSEEHNLYLWILNEVGVVGAIPFFIGLWLCIRAGYRGMNIHREGRVVFALAVAMLVFNLGITFHNRKVFWFLLAATLASDTLAHSDKRLRQKVT